MDKDVKVAEFELKLVGHLADIQRLYQKYNPDGKYLTISYQNGNWNFNNAYWGADSNFPLNGTIRQE